jgi:hypothetical protein
MKRLSITILVLLISFVASAQVPYKIHNNKLYLIWNGDTLKFKIYGDSTSIGGGNRLNFSHDSLYFPHLATGATDTNIMFVRGSDGKMMYLRPADIGIGNSYWSNNGSIHPTDTTNAVAIGTNSAPAGTMLRVNDGAVLFDGATGTTPVSGAGTRFMWIPSNGAFRAGYVDDTQWDNGLVGLYSTAMGYNTAASGEASTAMGSETTASGDYSTAMGYYTAASGVASTAMGYNTIASGQTSIAMGQSTTASGEASTAMGVSTAASGEVSTAMGQETTANSYNLFTAGSYNYTTSSTSKDSWVSTDPLFQVGNGTNDPSRNNAITILKNGTAYIGDASSTTDPILTVSTTDSTTTLIGILKLTPQDDPPVSASEGMIYADTDHHLYYYNGTAWVQLD